MSVCKIRASACKVVVDPRILYYPPGLIMTQFLAFLFLMLMAIPALIAITVGSRSILGFLWNGFWFYVIGQTAQVAFNSPDAQGLGVALLVIFIWRSLVFRPRQVFSFQNFQGFQGGRGFGSRPGGSLNHAGGDQPSRTQAGNEPREILEAEVIDVTHTEKKR